MDKSSNKLRHGGSDEVSTTTANEIHRTESLLDKAEQSLQKIEEQQLKEANENIGEMVGRACAEVSEHFRTMDRADELRKNAAQFETEPVRLKRRSFCTIL